LVAYTGCGEREHTGESIMLRTMLAVTSIAVLGTAGPAAAAATGPAAKPRSGLVLSYLADAGYAAAVTLTCDPAGGAHPKPYRACAVLAKAGGDPRRLKPGKAMCTLEYAPITAEVTGTWRGKKVHWSRAFGNTCDLTRTTGVLFTF
jgi:hypothetical protein